MSVSWTRLPCLSAASLELSARAMQLAAVHVMLTVSHDCGPCVFALSPFSFLLDTYIHSRTVISHKALRKRTSNITWWVLRFCRSLSYFLPLPTSHSTWKCPHLTFWPHLCLFSWTAKVGKTSLIMSLVSEEFPEVVRIYTLWRFYYFLGCNVKSN